MPNHSRHFRAVSQSIDAALGASVIITMQNYLSDLGAWVIIMGVTFVVCVLLFRRGIVGEIERWLARQS